MTLSFFRLQVKHHQSKETMIPIHDEGLHQKRQAEHVASTSSTTLGSYTATSCPPVTPARQTSTIATQTDDVIDWSANSLKKEKETRQVSEVFAVSCRHYSQL